MRSSTHSPLENWAALPLLGIETLLEPMPHAQFLVVAPHPDDETLGCGGVIALLCQLNYPVQVWVVSDGAKSHPNSRKYPAPALRGLRQQETIAALATLGVAAPASFLSYPDGAVPTPESKGWQQALSRCQIMLKNLAPTTIFLPWRGDPHRDHRASWQLMHTAAKSLPDSPRLIEYPIWDWDPNQRQEFGGLLKAWRLDIHTVGETKQQAIAQYRSQVTDLIDDDPAGFRLTPEMLANFAHPWEIYLELT